MIEVKRQIKMFKEELWNIIVVKTPFKQKSNDYDGFYEFWLNNSEYGHMMYLIGEAKESWKEAKKTAKEFMNIGFLRAYADEVKKLETDNDTPSSFSCPFIDDIILKKMKGVKNGNKKKHEETKG